MPILDALSPLGTDTNFPIPSESQVSGPDVPSVTYSGPTINGIPMPGRWVLTALTRQFGWQEQQASFLSGAYLVPKGDPLVHCEFEISIWQDGAWAIFNALLSTLFKKPIVSLAGVPASAALGIDHPALKAIGITNVVVDSIGYPLNPLVSSGGKGTWVGKMSFIEYRPAKPALPVPSQAIPDPGAVTPGASTNMATSQAAVAAGDDARQAAMASAIVPPR
jgi:hypothetical protein